MCCVLHLGKASRSHVTKYVAKVIVEEAADAVQGIDLTPRPEDLPNEKDLPEPAECHAERKIQEVPRVWLQAGVTLPEVLFLRRFEVRDDDGPFFSVACWILRLLTFASEVFPEPVFLFQYTWASSPLTEMGTEITLDSFVPVVAKGIIKRAWGTGSTEVSSTPSGIPSLFEGAAEGIRGFIGGRGE